MKQASKSIFAPMMVAVSTFVFTALPSSANYRAPGDVHLAECPSASAQFITLTARNELLDLIKYNTRRVATLEHEDVNLSKEQQELEAKLKMLKEAIPAPKVDGSSAAPESLKQATLETADVNGAKSNVAPTTPQPATSIKSDVSAKASVEPTKQNNKSAEVPEGTTTAPEHKPITPVPVDPSKKAEEVGGGTKPATGKRKYALFAIGALLLAGGAYALSRLPKVQEFFSNAKSAILAKLANR